MVFWKAESSRRNQRSALVVPPDRRSADRDDPGSGPRWTRPGRTDERQSRASRAEPDQGRSQPRCRPARTLVDEALAVNEADTPRQPPPVKTREDHNESRRRRHSASAPRAEHRRLTRRISTPPRREPATNHSRATRTRYVSIVAGRPKLRQPHDVDARQPGRLARAELGKHRPRLRRPAVQLEQELRGPDRLEGRRRRVQGHVDAERSPTGSRMSTPRSRPPASCRKSMRWYRTDHRTHRTALAAVWSSMRKCRAIAATGTPRKSIPATAALDRPDRP